MEQYNFHLRDNLSEFNTPTYRETFSTNLFINMFTALVPLTYLNHSVWLIKDELLGALRGEYSDV